MKAYPIKSKVYGFTLIEFLVASALAVIVVIAASSTYFTTRQLNASAQTRIDAQNNLRNAATMIARDARVAGSFGCMTTGGIAKTADANESVGTAKVFPSITDTALANTGNTNKGIELQANNGSGYGVSWLNVADVGLPDKVTKGITFKKGNALVFVYGKGSIGVRRVQPPSLELLPTSDSNMTAALESKTQMVLSNCQNAYTIKPTSFDNKKNILEFSGNTGISFMDVGTVTVSQLYAAAYVIGTVDGKQSLLRYDVGNDGAWQSPQLLATDVTGMEVSFAYQQECNDTNNPPSFTFAYSDTLSRQNLPALVQIKLITDNGSVSDEYVINASIRGGSQCANMEKIKLGA